METVSGPRRHPYTAPSRSMTSRRGEPSSAARYLGSLEVFTKMFRASACEDTVTLLSTVGAV